MHARPVIAPPTSSHHLVCHVLHSAKIIQQKVSAFPCINNLLVFWASAIIYMVGGSFLFLHTYTVCASVRKSRRLLAINRKNRWFALFTDLFYRRLLRKNLTHLRRYFHINGRTTGMVWITRYFSYILPCVFRLITTIFSYRSCLNICISLMACMLQNCNWQNLWFGVFSNASQNEYF